VEALKQPTNCTLHLPIWIQHGSALRVAGEPNRQRQPQFTASSLVEDSARSRARNRCNSASDIAPFRSNKRRSLN
jgi:hypothetical protein